MANEDTGECSMKIFTAIVASLTLLSTGVADVAVSGASAGDAVAVNEMPAVETTFISGPALMVMTLKSQFNCKENPRKFWCR